MYRHSLTKTLNKQLEKFFFGENINVVGISKNDLVNNVRISTKNKKLFNIEIKLKSGKFDENDLNKLKKFFLREKVKKLLKEKNES